jgi:TrkA-C domain.
VGSGSILENRTVEEIPRLSHTVLVNIKRQGADMIPDPDTKLLSGDFLYFLTESRHTEEIHHLCEAQIPKDHIR